MGRGSVRDLVTLRALLQTTIDRFRPENPLIPSNVFIFGFVTPTESASVAFSQAGVHLEDHIKEAEYILYATVDQLTALLDPAAPSRKAAFDAVQMRPHYPFNDYLLSIFLNSFDLSSADLDFTPQRFDGPYPFPPRYPAAENRYRTMTYTPEPLPTYDQSQLPVLVADDHPEWVAVYDFAWERAFKNLRQPEPGSGFVSNFIDPAFNSNTFMWDSAFMTMFGRYGRRLFPFIRSLDNFYTKQQDDGFICREINTFSGASVFQSLDPRSTGPNILAWAELEDFRHSGDFERLRAVFPALIAYHRWCRDWRTHPDGSYWTCGWGSGMDNQVRVPASEWHHRHYAWLDATLQAALNCRMLIEIGAAIRRDEFTPELQREYDHLTDYINRQLWDDSSGFYCDRAPDGRLSRVKSIGAYWGLQAEVFPADRRKALFEHLENPAIFNRPHRVPTQAADSESYNPHGGYWLGAVWSPTNYMVLRGLAQNGADALAHAIAGNHVEQVAQVFAETGTLWENYAPEFAVRGNPAGRDFVGWTGLSAISIPIEYLIGLRPAHEGLLWDIRLTGRHGVLRYPLGKDNIVDLVCEYQAASSEYATLDIQAAAAFQLHIRLNHVDHHLAVPAGKLHITL